jgi:endonuclease-8
MPEGDTIWRTARTLCGVLAGRMVTGFAASLPSVAEDARRVGIVGQVVAGVDSNGKHLLLRFSGGAVLHTHQRMTGTWHVYRRGTPWRRRRGAARVVIETVEAVAVCFSAPVVELLPPGGTAGHPPLRRLGPDLLSPDFDGDEARQRLRARAQMEVGAALLDQTALAGIGNVYKSEVCFLCGVNPFDRVVNLEGARLDTLVQTARREMLRNLGPGMRRTRPALAPGRLWVYGRSGEPCLRCGAAVRHRVQGEQARSTYWCPVCQPRRAGAGASQSAPPR